MQEKKLAELVGEFGMSGKQAHKLIANALPGGFSVIAIKKNMARLGLHILGQSNTHAGSDDSDQDANDECDPERSDATSEDEFNGDQGRSADALEDDVLYGTGAIPKKKATLKSGAKKRHSAAEAIPDSLQDELEDDMFDSGTGDMRGRDVLQSGSDELPAGVSDTRKRKKELKKLHKLQRKPGSEARKGKHKAQKEASAPVKGSKKPTLAAALRDLVAEVVTACGGVCTL
jgi:hypothetical protein